MDATLNIASMLGDIPTLPPALAGPLTQIADVVSVTVDAVKLMRENQDECAHLVSRVLRFLRSLIDNLRASNVTIADSTLTAANLFTLRRYVFRDTSFLRTKAFLSIAAT